MKGHANSFENQRRGASPDFVIRSSFLAQCRQINCPFLLHLTPSTTPRPHSQTPTISWGTVLPSILTFISPLSSCKLSLTSTEFSIKFPFNFPSNLSSMSPLLPFNFLYISPQFLFDFLSMATQFPLDFPSSFPSISPEFLLYFPYCTSTFPRKFSLTSSLFPFNFSWICP